MGGRKVWASGDILTAADVNDYLMDQSVMVFAGTAARASAIASPSEGMVTYRSDDNVVEAYTGAAWQSIGGKILQVVRATDSSSRTTTSTSFVDASISVTITPQKSSSAVMLIWACSANPDLDRRMTLQITDNSNVAISGAQSHEVGKATASGGQVYPVTLIAYATPATTSAVTYKGRFATVAGGTATLNNSGSTGQLFAIEVAA